MTHKEDSKTMNFNRLGYEPKQQQLGPGVQCPLNETQSMKTRPKRHQASQLFQINLQDSSCNHSDRG